MPQSAFKDMRVLEVGDDGIAGFAGRWFADSGADVVRLIDPARPSAPRAISPYLQRGKTNVAVDLHAADAGSRLAALAAGCDVLLSDLSPADVDRLRLAEVRGGRLQVRALATPFGLSGPYRDAPSTHATLLAISGHTFMTGTPGRAPLTLAGEYVAYQVGLVAYTAALSTLLSASRAELAAPSTVEICALEVLASLHQYTTVLWSYARRVRVRPGNQYDGTYPITILPCADGWFGICIVQPFWEAFARWMNPAWLEDPRFATSPLRAQHAHELDAEIATAISGRSKRDLEREGQLIVRVPCGAVNTPHELLADPHLASRGFWERMTVNGHERLIPGRPFRVAPAATAAPRASDAVAGSHDSFTSGAGRADAGAPAEQS